MKKIIAIIPARGGSKGIINKNIRLLAGNPLIYYTISAAQNSKYISQVIVSTDDAKIEDLALIKGAVVIKRPEEISRDDSSTIDAVLHVLRHCEIHGIEYDMVVLLQPTSPLRSSSDIDAAIDIFLQNQCDSVISVTEANHSPYWNMILKGQYLHPLIDNESLNMRRQDLQKTYLPNGAIYIASAEMLHRTRSFYTGKTKPYIMPAERSIDIDSEFDLLFAECIMSNGENYD